jgi:hypothetical protein
MATDKLGYNLIIDSINRINVLQLIRKATGRDSSRQRKREKKYRDKTLIQLQSKR